MHDFIKRNKREIIVGVGVSIITTFIMGIGNWFFANAPKIGTSILDTLLNIAYTLAATRTDNQIIVMILSGLLLFVFVSLLPPFTRVMSPFISAIKSSTSLKC